MTDTVAFSDNFAVTTKKGILGAANTQNVELKERLPGKERLFSRVYVDRFGMVTGGVFAEDAGLPDDPQFGGQMGMRVPSGTSDQRPTNGVAIIRYNTDLKAFEVNEGGSWVRPFQASNLRAVESDILPNVQSSHVYQVNVGSREAPFVSGTFEKIVLVPKAVLSDADLAADVLVNKNGTLYFGGVAIGGMQPFDLLPATDETLGGVIIGSGINVETDGTISIEFKVKGTASDTKPGTLEDKIVGAGGITVSTTVDPTDGSQVVIDGSKIKTYGAAGGDLVGAFPDPIVRQVTGVPATLTGSQATFDWKNAGDWAAGAGIGYGFGYIGGVHKRCWMANSQLGELHATYDDWKSVVHVPSTDLMFGTYTDANGKVFEYSDLTAAVGTSPRFASATYINLPGSVSMYWVFSANGHLYAIEDILANYHDNGALKIENIFEITLAGDLGDPNSLSYGNNTLVFVGNNAAMYYAEAADMNWTTKTLTTHSVSSTVTDTVPDPDESVAIGVMGGITFDGTRFLTVGRDTGVLLQSTTGKTWSILRVNSVKFQDDTNMLRRSVKEHTFALPMNTQVGQSPAWSYNDNVCWGGMLYAYDRFIVVNGKTAPSAVSSYWSPFLFSYDGANWFAYKPTQVEMESNYTYSCYKLAAGNHRVYATNSNPAQESANEPSIYRLLVDEVPFHANLMAEKDLMVLGETTLVGNASADYLSTDSDGAVVSHSLPANASVIGTDANRNLVSKTLALPVITVSVSDPTGTPADGDLWLKVAAI